MMVDPSGGGVGGRLCTIRAWRGNGKQRLSSAFILSLPDQRQIG
jgi:hypothetical protein